MSRLYGLQLNTRQDRDLRENARARRDAQRQRDRDRLDTLAATGAVLSAVQDGPLVCPGCGATFLFGAACADCGEALVDASLANSGTAVETSRLGDFLVPSALAIVIFGGIVLLRLMVFGGLFHQLYYSLF